MDSEKKVVVVAKDGVGLIGNHYHELHDETSMVFVSDDLYAVVKHLAGSGGLELYVCRDGVSAYNGEAKPSINCEPLAEYRLAYSEEVELLKKQLNTPMSAKGCEIFLRTMARYSGEEECKILDFAKDVKVSKVVSYESKKDNRGNVTYAYKRESGTGDFDPPQALSFTVPVLKNCDKTRSFMLDFYFDFTEGEKPSAIFTFKSMSLAREVEGAAREIIDEAVKTLVEVGATVHHGKLDKRVHDDSWKYLANPIA